MTFFRRQEICKAEQRFFEHSSFILVFVEYLSKWHILFKSMTFLSVVRAAFWVFLVFVERKRSYTW